MIEDKYIFNLAAKMHHEQCRYNHTDGCGWYYLDTFPKNWREKCGYEHKVYLKKAEAYLTLALSKNEGKTLSEIIQDHDDMMMDRKLKYLYEANEMYPIFEEEDNETNN